MWKSRRHHAQVAWAFDGAGSVVVSTTNGDHPNLGSSGINTTRGVNRYWTLTNSGTTFGSADATLNWLAGDVDAALLGAADQLDAAGRRDVENMEPSASQSCQFDVAMDGENG